MVPAYDALIVGAGLSGLAAGIRLAHFGRRVLLAERHDRAGGLNSWYRRDGREISVGLHALTNAAPPGQPGGRALKRLLGQLRLGRDEWRLPPLAPQRGSSIRFPGATLRFANDPVVLEDAVAEVFTRAVDGFRELRAAVRDTDEAVTDGHRPASARERVAALVGEPLLAEMLLAAPLFYGSPTAGDMDWTAFCVLWKGIFESGLAIPEGGMRPVLERLVERFRAAGGELRLGVGVESLDAGADGTIRAARLSDGDEVMAKLIFSSAGGAETYALVADVPGAADANGAAADFGGASPISIVEALAVFPEEPAAAGLADATVFYSFADRLDFAPPADGLWRRDNGVVAVPNNFATSTPFPEGQVRLSALADFGRWRDLLGGIDARWVAPEKRSAYRAAKEEAARSLWDAAVRLGLRPAAPPVFVDVFTPLTLARYAGHIDGALYGSPGKRRDARTAWPNLFLIGADQGFHGIVGALLSGVTVANRYGLDAPD